LVGGHQNSFSAIYQLLQHYFQVKYSGGQFKLADWQTWGQSCDIAICNDNASVVVCRQARASFQVEYFFISKTRLVVVLYIFAALAL
jgi:hypothetical protein